VLLSLKSSVDVSVTRGGGGSATTAQAETVWWTRRFYEGWAKTGPAGASEITQTEILRSHNATREFRERYRAGHHDRKTSARWPEKAMDRWYRSVGRQKPGLIVRQAENRKSYRCLVHEAAYARTSGTVSWWYRHKLPAVHRLADAQQLPTPDWPTRNLPATNHRLRWSPPPRHAPR